MASRRLKSDRFFTTDYTPKVYTQVGLDWIEDNSMRSVLLRHFPQLGPALAASRTLRALGTRVRSRLLSRQPQGSAAAMRGRAAPLRRPRRPLDVGAAGRRTSAARADISQEVRG